ncbi:MAG: hypothetical protein OXU75_22745 [Deltaproteobacteria bacterium]|nr:hypothetical protein [Deltaproteobacteria bacterium]
MTYDGSAGRPAPPQPHMPAGAMDPGGFILHDFIRHDRQSGNQGCGRVCLTVIDDPAGSRSIRHLERP